MRFKTHRDAMIQNGQSSVFLVREAYKKALSLKAFQVSELPNINTGKKRLFWDQLVIWCSSLISHTRIFYKSMFNSSLINVLFAWCF